MFLHVLGKKVVARFLGYFSNMHEPVIRDLMITSQESVMNQQSPQSRQGKMRK